MDWMFEPLRRYADFKGRSRRKEYWSFVLLQMIVYLLAAIPASIDGFEPDGIGITITVWLMVIVMLVFAVPALAVQVRRLHDRDASGWWILVTFLPYLGFGWLLVYMLWPGTVGPNRFGPDPRLRPGSHDPEAGKGARYSGYRYRY